MRILITGGAGFVGSNLVAHLASTTTHDLVVLDNESLGSRSSIQSHRHSFIKGDILDATCLRQAMNGVDVVVHLAADTRVMDSIANPQHNFRNNVIGTFQLLDMARLMRTPRIVIASTGGAILGNVTPPIHERMMAQPLAPYGASKLAVEGYASAFAAAYNMSVVCLRFSNVYGPGSLHKGSVVAHFCKSLRVHDDLVVFGDGSQCRDFLYVGDLMLGIERIISSDAGGVFQLGSGAPTSVNELLDALRRILGNKFASAIRYEPFRAGEVRDTWCDISKARAMLGFEPETRLEDGLRQTWSWFERQSIEHHYQGA